MNNYRWLKGSLLFVWYLSCAWAQTPILMELAVEGTEMQPQLTPLALEFEVNKEYVLRISNAQTYSVLLHYDKFAQKIVTYYLQGASNVGQENITLAPSSILMWHFLTKEGGEFPYWVQTGVAKQEKSGIFKINQLTKKEEEISAVSSIEPKKVDKKRLLLFRSRYR